MSSWKKLPIWWDALTPPQRGTVIAKLQDGVGLLDMPTYWRYRTYADRCVVIRYLYGRGLLDENQYDALFTQKMPVNVAAQIRQFDHGLPTPPIRPSQVEPGKRILPSRYTLLTDVWVCNNGRRVQPKDMHTRHLENTLALLRESHGNLMSKSSELLGKLANHYRNHPNFGDQMEEAYHIVQETEVDEVYPIFKVLAQELFTRSLVPVQAEFDAWDNDEPDFDL